MEDAYVSAAELAARIRRRDVSPVEVLDACFARIEARDPSLNAFVHTAFDEAREAARAAERAVTAGEELGLLHGLPTAIKDLWSYKSGWPATYGGVRALKGSVVDFSSIFTERVERAGAIVIGMTNSPVMGFRGTCDNPLFGPTRNPFDLARNAGGSSGGSAAAVADGLLPMAQGTDGGGSIRIPAAWCGVYGFKPSFGRIPFTGRPNGFGALNPFIFTGPIARTVEDAALTMTALSGYDARDPFALDEDADFRGVLDRSLDGVRIAYSPDFGTFPVDPRVRDSVAQAVRAFEEAGARVEQVDIDLGYDQRKLSDLWCRLIIPGNIETLEGIKAGGLDLLAHHRDDFPAPYLRWIDEGYRLSAMDVLGDQWARTAVYDAVQAVLDRYDLLVTPTLACLPVENAAGGDTIGPSEIEGVEVDPLIGWCLTYIANFTGHPAASVPAGMVDGLPVGMQLTGRRYADADVLAASAAFERLRPWSDAYAICARRPLKASA